LHISVAPAGPTDPRINLHDTQDVERWCRVLGITGEVLRAAVEKVGPSANRVLDHLNARHRRPYR
jgi:hypothetical protein